MTLATAKGIWVVRFSHASPGWQLLSMRNFGLLWLGQVISQMGDGLTKVALLWFVYQLTGSALKMTTVGVLQTLTPTSRTSPWSLRGSAAEKTPYDLG